MFTELLAITCMLVLDACGIDVVTIFSVCPLGILNHDVWTFEIDVLPDTMEKAIYKKCIKILFAIILEMKDNI